MHTVKAGWGHAILWVGLLAFVTAQGCSGRAVREKLAVAGLELMDESVARVPAAQRGRYLPCRVMSGVSGAALEPHPAGYLIVGVNGREASRSGDILEAIERWREDVPLRLWVRRNPFTSTAPEWWEGDVILPGGSR